MCLSVRLFVQWNSCCIFQVIQFRALCEYTIHMMRFHIYCSYSSSCFFPIVGGIKLIVIFPRIYESELKEIWKQASCQYSIPFWCSFAFVALCPIDIICKQELTTQLFFQTFKYIDLDHHRRALHCQNTHLLHSK